jgi:5-formyltetrahydrofolate cyclo-ligase
MGNKEELRNFFLKFRRNIKEKESNKASIMIKNKFFKMLEVKEALKILVYVSYRNEVNTHGIIKRLLVEGKRVFVPYCIVDVKKLKVVQINNMDSDLQEGAYGILEPREELKKDDFNIKELDIVIVPGVAFSKQGYRIGYGGGYYDRLLENLTLQTITIGLSYNSLVLNNLPIAKYDKAVDIIVTEEDILYCNK